MHESGLATFKGHTGIWRTIRGAHVFIDTDGVVRSGPDEMVGKKMAARMVSAKKPTIRAGFREATAEDRKAHKIPPAWTDVVVAGDPNASLIAIGRDSAGRAQYRYSAAHHEQASARKFERARRFDAEVPRIMGQIDKDATAGKQEAIVLRIIATTGMRIGGDSSRGKVEAFGVSTLRMDHVTTDGSTVNFDFIGKEGVHQMRSMHDPVVAAWVRKRKADGAETVFDVSQDKIRAYLKDLAPGFLVKDFRTRVANAVAFDAISKMDVPTTAKERQARINAVGQMVADVLGNTRAVALSAYVNPILFDVWEERP